MRKIMLPAFACGVAAAAVTPAFAADMPEPAPIYAPAPEPVVEFGGWYLRGDIGVTNQQVKSLDNPYWHEGTNDFTATGASFEAGGYAGVGFGYQFNSWFRTDATIEYRAASQFTGSDTHVPADISDPGYNDYTANKTEIVGMLNAYFDLGTWGGFTPFVGAGIGAANISIHDFVDSPSGSTALDSSRLNFAWALMAGLGYEISPGITLEAAYRYIDMGDAQSGTIVYANNPGPDDAYGNLIFKDVTSHDVHIGLRWALGGTTVSQLEPQPQPMEPLITK